jgi:hypothetical protein
MMNFGIFEDAEVCITYVPAGGGCYWCLLLLLLLLVVLLGVVVAVLVGVVVLVVVVVTILVCSCTYADGAHAADGAYFDDAGTIKRTIPATALRWATNVASCSSAWPIPRMGTSGKCQCTCLLTFINAHVFSRLYHVYTPCAVLLYAVFALTTFPHDLQAYILYTPPWYAYLVELIYSLASTCCTTLYVPLQTQSVTTTPAALV